MKTISKLIISLFMMISIFNPIESHAATNKIKLEYLDINEVDPKPYYSWGDNPSVTVLDNGLVLSVSDYLGDLTYTLGEYYNGEVYWTFPVAYDTGTDPSVITLDDGELLEIHFDPRGVDNIYYNLGRYENGKINWYSIGNKIVDTVQARDDNITVTQSDELGIELVRLPVVQ
ncbi:hypothetical protein [Jeotgalibacillus marinus]|uniref:Uncharacterized protein n=1 Tax=Jeotgalibacillus marinus TaxID=86667 RepID=A0ABV3Q7Q5_9BACL